MTADDFATRVSRLAALAEPVRRAVYRFVASQSGPVSRDQAAEGLGIARHTAKFHLDRLVRAGLLETEARRLSGRSGPGAGRPAKLYRRCADEVVVSLPPRHYDLAAALMASAIDESSSRGSEVVASLHRSAAEHGSRLGAAARRSLGQRAERDRALDAVCEVLTEAGYEPRQDAGVVELANCPFHALVRKHTGLVCGMNLALLTALAETSGAQGLSARLDPGRGRCCVTLAVGSSGGTAREGPQERAPNIGGGGGI